MAEGIEGRAGGVAPPVASTPELRSLWWAHRGGWEKAHRLVQDGKSPDAAWVHA